MPIYEYKCEACGNIHAEHRAMEDRKGPTKCLCGGEAKFVLSRPGRFQRGPGWSSRMDGAKMPGEA